MLRAYIAAAILSGGASASSGVFISSLSYTNGSSGVNTTTSGILPCDALIEAGLGDRLLFATDPGYEPEVESWYSENSRQRPYCFVLPRNREEVATTLTTLVGVDNGAGDWHIAVRSGGHSSIGSNNIDNGVTIDLSLMNSSSYDPQTNIACIEPGGRWRDVYADLDKQGAVVTGGRDGDVGVGGFLIGGGNSFFSGRMGFGCDSVVNFEVVLANGTIVNANSTSNADLWKALKGGTSNFGIVTRYDMEALPARDLYYDLRYLSYNYSEAAIEAVAEFADQDQSLHDNALVTFFTYNASMSSEISIGEIYVNTQGHSNVTTSFDKVKNLPAMLNVSVSQSMAKAAAGSQVPGGTRDIGTTLTFYNDPRILRRCNELHEQFIETLKHSIDPTKFVTMVFFQPIPSYMGKVAEERGGNMLGFKNSVQHNAILWTFGVAIQPDQGDEAFAIARAELKALTAQVKEYARSVQGDIDFVYLNYADASQDPLGSYGADNIQHIRDVAAKYDPNEVFQKRIPGGFKISRVK
ncbi:FAD binding domain-containing protein [Hypoxylon trugodes]|uniref:FAD binding domain-containing protein n=1 Tax=Hypoxylon trugodes TaxID=326681 RepID=UPI002195217B|nr:FAD binding domain-containing protein [Hypoxylon trugodes]KAI1393317.1 FAD binding domain-containing protein [Hypoxylon trugodes]